MSEDLSPVAVTDLTWINDEEYLNNLEMLVRKGMTASQCAKILRVQTSAVAFVLQSNPKLKEAQLEALDRTRFTVTRRAAERSEEVLDHLFNIISDEGDEDQEGPKVRDRIAASNLYLQAAGVIGNKATASENAMRQQRDQGSAVDTQTALLFNILLDRMQGDPEKLG